MLMLLFVVGGGVVLVVGGGAVVCDFPELLLFFLCVKALLSRSFHKLKLSLFFYVARFTQPDPFYIRYITTNNTNDDNNDNQQY